MLSARETFHTTDGRCVVAGELVDPESDLVAGREHLFAVVNCSCGGAGDEALAELQAEAAAAAAVNAELQAKVDELTAALEAATKTAEPDKTSTAKAKG